MASNPDVLHKALVGAALGFGGVALVAPDSLGAVYGMSDHSPDVRYTTRLWGAAVVGLCLVSRASAPGAERRRVSYALAVGNALDVGSALATADLPTRAKVLAVATSAAFLAGNLAIANAQDA